MKSIKSILPIVAVVLMGVSLTNIGFHFGKRYGRQEALEQIEKALIEKGLLQEQDSEKSEVVLFNIGMNDIKNKSIHAAVKSGWPQNKINQ